MVGNDYFAYGEYWCSSGGYLGGGGYCLSLIDWQNDPISNPNTVNLNWSAGWSSVSDSSGGYGTHHTQSSWASESGTVAYFQNDGNFVLLNGGSTVVWETYTGNHSGAYLNVQSDGNLVVYSSSNSPLWSLF
jgi:hypothetical protein